MTSIIVYRENNLKILRLAVRYLPNEMIKKTHERATGTTFVDREDTRRTVASVKYCAARRGSHEHRVSRDRCSALASTYV